MRDYVRGSSHVSSLSLCCVLLLSACGGGGGDGGGGSNPPGTTPQPGSVQLSADTLSVDENGTAQLTITRTGGSDGAVSVTIASSDGTASAGADYSALNSTVSFAAGDAAAKTVMVTLSDDGQGESDETLTVTLSAPTGGARLGTTTSATITVRDNDPPVAPVLHVAARTRQLRFSWANAPGATSHRLLASPDGISGFTQVATDEPSYPAIDLDISVHVHDWVNARYRLEACNAHGCSASAPISVVEEMIRAIGYFKASNTQAGDSFGHTVVLSADGRTLAVGAPFEGGDDTPAGQQSGAVYVFTRANADWLLMDYLKADAPQAFSRFGQSLAISADGGVIVVGAPFEDAAGPDGVGAGAIYVFTGGPDWTQRFHTSAHYLSPNASFGHSVAITADGATIAVGARRETLNVNGTIYDQAGGAYVYVGDGAGWAFHDHVIATAPQANAAFGGAVTLSADGATLAVGAPSEQNMGSVHVFTRNTGPGPKWPLQRHFVGNNTEPGDSFGSALALSADGNTLAVGAPGERSASAGVSDGPNGANDDDTLLGAGASYIFARDASEVWSQQVYVKSSNPKQEDGFGTAVSLSPDGNILAVGSPGEDGDGVGVGEDGDNGFAGSAGAVNLYKRSSAGWSPGPYVKASNTGGGDRFGYSVTLSGDGATLAVGAIGESGNATGTRGDQQNNDAPEAGAVYMY